MYAFLRGDASKKSDNGSMLSGHLVQIAEFCPDFATRECLFAQRKTCNPHPHGP